MDLIDIAIKGGLGITAVIFLGLLLLEQKRHDRTRKNYAEYERERRALDREVERDRISMQRERIDADKDATRVLTELTTRIQLFSGANR
jgi:hypothetical protein